jgi:hypothetical protein
LPASRSLKTPSRSCFIRSLATFASDAIGCDPPGLISKCATRFFDKEGWLLCRLHLGPSAGKTLNCSSFALSWTLLNDVRIEQRQFGGQR